MRLVIFIMGTLIARSIEPTILDQHIIATVTAFGIASLGDAIQLLERFNKDSWRDKLLKILKNDKE